MDKVVKKLTPVRKETLLRLPEYLLFFRKLHKQGEETVSAVDLCTHFGITAVQLKKDFSSIGSKCKPDIPLVISDCISAITDFLDYDNTKDAVLIGAGQLGRTLMGYSGFAGYGLNIVAAFDVDFNVVGASISGRQVLSVEKLKTICERLNIHIGIITVPARSAQHVCNLLVKCGVLAIWNFAPVRLEVPDGIIVQNENMAASLAVLSNKLSASMYDKQKGKKLIQG